MVHTAWGRFISCMWAYCCVFSGWYHWHISCMDLVYWFGGMWGFTQWSKQPNPRFISLLIADNNRVASFIVHLSLLMQWSRCYDDVYKSQVYLGTSCYCHQSDELIDMLSQIRRLNTLLFNIGKKLPPLYIEISCAYGDRPRAAAADTSATWSAAAAFRSSDVA